MKEDEREEKELRGYVAQSLTADMINSFPGAMSLQDQEVKTPAEVQQETPAWSNQQDSR